MSKSTSCFPSMRCLTKSKSSTSTKIKSAVRMPSLREFLNSHNSAGTQTSIYDPEAPKHGENTSIASKAETPLSHKSTIAIRYDNSFVPLMNVIPKFNPPLKQESPNASILSKLSVGSRSNNTLFLSKGSFDEIFAKKNEKLEKNTQHEGKIQKIGEIIEKTTGPVDFFSDSFEHVLEKLETNDKIIEKKSENEEKDRFDIKINVGSNDKIGKNCVGSKLSPKLKGKPLVISTSRMPRIIPITPGKRKRSANSRPLVKFQFKPIIPNTITDFFNEEMLQGIDLK